MKKKVTVMILAVLLFVCGCGSKKDDEAFNIETDWQYQMVNPHSLKDRMTTDPQGSVYFLNGYFLYKYDFETGETAPLCSRPNCLHNQETDPEKIIKCNAFFDFAGEPGDADIYYEDGNIYLVYLTEAAGRNVKKVGENSLRTRLVRIAADGQSRETVRIIEDKPPYVRLHRGRCYYEIYWYEEDRTEHKEIHSFSLSRPSEDKLIMEIPEDMSSVLTYFLYPYGKYLYIYAPGYSEEAGARVKRLYKYNPENGKLEKLHLPEQKEVQDIGGVTAFQNKLHAFLYEDAYSESGAWTPLNLSPLYAMEMDGSSPREVMNLPAASVSTDGDYLYVSISGTALDVSGGSNEGKTAKVWVYDKEYQLVDTFGEDVYNGWQFDFARGIGGYGYRMLTAEEDEFYRCLQVFDKSRIGTLDGKNAEFTTIAELAASPADQSYTEFMKGGYNTSFFDGSFFDT